MGLSDTLFFNTPLYRAYAEAMIRRLWTEAGRPMYGQVVYLGRLDPHLLQHVKRRFKPRRMVVMDPRHTGPVRPGQLKGMEVMPGPCPPLPFSDTMFDAVVALNACHGVADWQLGLKEAARVLKPRGVLVFEDLAEDLPSLVGLPDWLSTAFGIEPREEDERLLTRASFINELAEVGLSLNFQRNLLLEGWFEGVATKE